jgi:hypothetical protein
MNEGTTSKIKKLKDLPIEVFYRIRGLSHKLPPFDLQHFTDCSLLIKFTNKTPSDHQFPVPDILVTK